MRIPLLFLFVFLLPNTPLRAGEWVMVEFDEGTILYGDLIQTQLLVQVFGTELKVDIDRIQKISFDPDGTKVDLANGDRISDAEVPREVFHLDSVVGRVEMQKKRIRRIVFLHRVAWVSTPQELVRAIKSHATIRVRPGTYDLTGYHNMRSPHVKAGPRQSIQLVNLRNFTMEGHGKKRPKIIVSPLMADTLFFKNGNNIELKNLEIGHSPKGQCMGGVLRFDGCDDVRVENCDLFGCGTQGISFDSGSGLFVTNTIIRDCTSQILHVNQAQNVKFLNCRFERNQCYSGIQVEQSQNVLFDGCVLRNNVQRRNIPLFQVTGSSNLLVVRSDCDDSNKFSRLDFPKKVITFQGRKPKVGVPEAP